MGFVSTIRSTNRLQAFALHQFGAFPRYIKPTPTFFTRAITLSGHNIYTNNGIHRFSQRKESRFLATTNDIENNAHGTITADDDDDDDPDLSDTIAVDNDEDPEEIALLNEQDFSKLPRGTNSGYFVIKQYKTSTSEPFDMNKMAQILDASDIERLFLTPQDVSLPVALMMLDPEEYPSFSRARKACRKGNILIHQGPFALDESTGEETIFDLDKCIRGFVGDRVFPGGAFMSISLAFSFFAENKQS
jgi:hypothetical protein